MLRSAEPLRYALEELVSPCREALGDAELLRRFAESVDQAAFAELVRRHGRLVLGTARRVLDHPQDAEDVFQATFLVLARKASALSASSSVAGMLHGIALRIAQKALTATARRRQREHIAARSETCASEYAALELRWQIDEQLERLPEALRLPVILCLLEGQSQEQAARQLGCLPRTLKDRLRRGKELLRDRLGQAGVIAAGMETLADVPSPSAGLVEATARLSALFAEGLADEGAVVALARGGLWALSWVRMKVAVALLVLTSFVGVGVLLAGISVKEAHKAAPPPVVRKDRLGDPLPEGAIARLGTARLRHPGGWLSGLGMTPDGRLVVTGSDEGGLHVWEANSGRLVRQVKMDFHTRGFALSPDGELASLAGFRTYPDRDSEGVVRVVRVGDGKEVRTWLRQDDRHDDTKMAISPDGKKLASLSDAGIFRLEDIATGAELLRHQFARNRPARVLFSREGSLLVIGLRGNAPNLFLWRWQVDAKPSELKLKTGSLGFLDLSPDSKILATADEYDTGISLWDIATAKLIRNYRHGRDSYSWGHFSPDGKYLVGARYRAGLILLDATTGEEVRRLPGGSLPIFSPDARKILAVDDGTVRVWDVATGKEAVPFPEAHRYPPSFVRLLGDDVAVTAGDDGTVRFWDAKTSKQTQCIEANDHWVRATALSPDGRWFATSEMGEKQGVSLWDRKTGQRVYRLEGHGQVGGCRAVAFTPDSKRLVSWGDDRYLRVWDVKTGKAVAEHGIAPDGLDGPVDEEEQTQRVMMDVSREGFLSGDASLFVTARGESLYLFDVVTGKQKAKFAFAGGDLAAAVFSPDKRMLLVTGRDSGKTVLVQGKQRFVGGDAVARLYDVASGVLNRSISFPGDYWLPGAAWRPDGKGFAITRWRPEPCIRFFDAEGRAQGTVKLPTRPRSLAFAPDGWRLIAGLEDTTALILEVPTK